MKKIVDQSNLNAFANCKIDMIQELQFILDRIENIVGKEKMLAFSPFPTMFLKAFFLRNVKSQESFLKV